VISKDIMYKLCFYVPKSHLEVVKEALFSAGAGRYKNYDQCSWEVLGEGQFRPLEKSNPFTGNKFELKKIPEYRVEMVIDFNEIEKIIQILHEVHPYEEPAYEFWQINYKN
tara:strand:+ start:219 stop:551 length:333 start_codon:yes stop_codon:yes gene_type:complete